MGLRFLRSIAQRLQHRLVVHRHRDDAVFVDLDGGDDGPAFGAGPFGAVEHFGLGTPPGAPRRRGRDEQCEEDVMKSGRCSHSNAAVGWIGMEWNTKSFSLPCREYGS